MPTESSVGKTEGIHTKCLCPLLLFNIVLDRQYYPEIVPTTYENLLYNKGDVSNPC